MHNRNTEKDGMLYNNVPICRKVCSKIIDQFQFNNFNHISTYTNIDSIDSIIIQDIQFEMLDRKTEDVIM